MPKVVLVLSGKGGVGKTLIAVNLALRLKEKGARVGLLDADFSASNSAYFLNIGNEQMQMVTEEFKPVIHDGIEVFSVSTILGEKSVCMTGDQYTQLLRDAAEATAWNAEYLIIDCPAGFGDELTTAAKIFADSLLGSIIVVQPAHELDGRRAIQLHKDLEMPILGLIENMTYFQAGAVPFKIFGESVVDPLGEEYKIPVFGKIPLCMKIRQQIEQKDPKLKDKNAEPIINAVEAIIQAKPQKPGFLVKIKQFLKGQMEKFVIQMAISINQEIDIPNIQTQYGYPGGRIIRLNICTKDMSSIIVQSDWILNDGKLTAAQGNYHIDEQIDIIPEALKWTILGNKILSDGYAYTFVDAQRLGHMRIYGPRTMARAAFFMQQVFVALSQNEAAMQKLRPILEVL